MVLKVAQKSIGERVKSIPARQYLPLIHIHFFNMSSILSVSHLLVSTLINFSQIMFLTKL